MRSLFLIALATPLFASAAIAQMQSLTPKDTFAAAKLSPKEVHEIEQGVELSAFDTPDSWTRELRVRRIDLGAAPGLLVQGSSLLCGGTGNCQMWVFRKLNGRWLSLFGTQEAPLAESFQLGPGISNGVKNLTIVANTSAEAGKRVTYKFDGKLHRAN